MQPPTELVVLLAPPLTGRAPAPRSEWTQFIIPNGPFSSPPPDPHNPGTRRPIDGAPTCDVLSAERKFTTSSADQAAKVLRTASGNGTGYVKIVKASKGRYGATHAATETCGTKPHLLFDEDDNDDAQTA